MRRLLFVSLFLAFAAPAAAAPMSLDSHLMEQPGAPVRVVGCSGEPFAMHNGRNIRLSASFVVLGTKTATAVRIGFATFDVLGGRHVAGGVTTGKFSPGARIDVHPFAGTIGAETKNIVCFAMQASFEDGTMWNVPSGELPRTPQGEAAAGPVLPTEIVVQPDSPVRFDRCVLYGPRAGFVTTDVALTNAGDKAIRLVDVDFSFVDASGRAVPHVQQLRGDYDPGAPILEHVRLETQGSAIAKIRCSVAGVEFADGMVWGRR